VCPRAHLDAVDWKKSEIEPRLSSLQPSAILPELCRPPIIWGMEYAYFVSLVIDVIDGCDLRYHHGIQQARRTGIKSCKSKATFFSIDE
jgi:hypothetical protein